MGVSMMCRFGAQFALRVATAGCAVVLSASAFAAELPEIKLSDDNKVPACVTPGRLTAFLEARNGSMDPKFAAIAADYNRIGEELGIRWDTAFFQMVLETGNLTFTGDVSADQNNFAGLGATGKGESGEKFPDVATGVKAHLQHLLLYAGEKLDNPVAERTRKVQEWGVLTAWQKTIHGPMTYVQLAKKWAPGSRNYAHEIEGVADSFYSGPCKGADPKPEMMALVHPEKAHPGKDKHAVKTAAKAAAVTVAADENSAPADEIATAEATVAAPETAAEQAAPKISGAELARRAVAEARASGSFVRSSLGAGSLADTPEDTAKAAPEIAEEKQPSPAFRIINAQSNDAENDAPPAAAEEAKAEAAAQPAPKEPSKDFDKSPAMEKADKLLTAATEKSATEKATTEKAATAKAAVEKTVTEKSTTEKVRTAALGAGTRNAALAVSEKVAPSSKCRVWTASYGGSRAIIIKAASENAVNYTVLDVNEGTEKREADAYIAAYAKGGQTVGEYANQTQALDKAFELCPEG